MAPNLYNQNATLEEALAGLSNITKLEKMGSEVLRILYFEVKKNFSGTEFKQTEEVQNALKQIMQGQIMSISKKSPDKSNNLDELIVEISDETKKDIVNTKTLKDYKNNLVFILKPPSKNIEIKNLIKEINIKLKKSPDPRKEVKAFANLGKYGIGILPITDIGNTPFKSISNELSVQVLELCKKNVHPTKDNHWINGKQYAGWVDYIQQLKGIKNQIKWLQGPKNKIDKAKILKDSLEAIEKILFISSLVTIKDRYKNPDYYKEDMGHNPDYVIKNIQKICVVLKNTKKLLDVDRRYKPKLTKTYLKVLNSIPKSSFNKDELKELKIAKDHISRLDLLLQINLLKDSNNVYLFKDPKRGTFPVKDIPLLMYYQISNELTFRITNEKQKDILQKIISLRELYPKSEYPEKYKAIVKAVREIVAITIFTRIEDFIKPYNNKVGLLRIKKDTGNKIAANQCLDTVFTTDLVKALKEAKKNNKISDFEPLYKNLRVLNKLLTDVLKEKDLPDLKKIINKLKIDIEKK